MTANCSTLNFEDLRGFVEKFVADEPGRSGAAGIWRTPLMAAAPADERFEALRSMGVDDHLLPRDLLPSARSVVVFFIPIKQEIARENRKGDRPSRAWGVAYSRTNDVINRLSQELSRFLEGRGLHCGLTPATHNFNEDRLMARWSHRHLGNLVNLGRFGVNNMLITPAGCVGRLGSLVTDAELGEHPLIQTREACLLKAGKPCGRCIDICPVKALSTGGFDRRLCWNRLKDNRDTLADFADLPARTHVCGKCTVMMPCSFGNPVG
jgi:epoxyqueuosine reductase QueG